MHVFRCSLFSLALCFWLDFFFWLVSDCLYFTLHLPPTSITTATGSTSVTHISMSVLHASVVPVLLVSSQSYFSCLPSHRYLPFYSSHCGKYQSPSHFVGLVLSWDCLQIHLVQPYSCIVKVSSAERLQATSFLTHHKWVRIILSSRPLHSNYCKIFLLQYWQLPAWSSRVLLES